MVLSKHTSTDVCYLAFICVCDLSPHHMSSSKGILFISIKQKSEQNFLFQNNLASSPLYPARYLLITWPADRLSCMKLAVDCLNLSKQMVRYNIKLTRNLPALIRSIYLFIKRPYIIGSTKEQLKGNKNKRTR